MKPNKRRLFLVLLMLPAVVGAAGMLQAASQDGNRGPIRFEAGERIISPASRYEDEEFRAPRSLHDENIRKVLAAESELQNIESSGSQSEALQNQIVQMKIDAEREFLEAKAEFARAAGDEAGLAEVNRARDYLEQSLRQRTIDSAPVQTYDKRGPSGNGGRP